jgi:hypothetical protein
MELKHRFIVVPNPSKGHAMAMGYADGPVHVLIKLYNLNSAQCMILDAGQQPIGAMAIDLDTPGLASGVYLAQLETLAEDGTRARQSFKMAVLH